MKHVGLCDVFFMAMALLALWVTASTEFPKNSAVKSQEGSIEEAFR